MRFTDKFVAALIPVIQEAFQNTIKQDVESCVSCKNFVEANEVCTLTNPPQRPPARIIAFGCPSHEFVDYEIYEEETVPEPAPPLRDKQLAKNVGKTIGYKGTDYFDDTFDDEEIPF